MESPSTSDRTSTSSPLVAGLRIYGFRHGLAQRSYLTARSLRSASIVLRSRVPILLLDEPLASLDPLARREFLEVLRSAAEPEGRTVVLSSHVVGDISQVCDWIVVLGAGMKSLDCSISDALARHRVLGPSERRVDEDRLVAPLPDGRLVVASREPSEAPGASLEEIVLAYLARGRIGAGTLTARE